MGKLLVYNFVSANGYFKGPNDDISWAHQTTSQEESDFAAENANVMSQYSDLVTPGEVDSEQEITKGEGAVLRDGLTKVAVYRDDDGTVHRMSAICVHLGCVVTWNGSEKTWDCPCHGSRYDRFGGVINGPANRDLPPHPED